MTRNYDTELREETYNVVLKHITIAVTQLNSRTCHSDKVDRSAQITRVHALLRILEKLPETDAQTTELKVVK